MTKKKIMTVNLETYIEWTRQLKNFFGIQFYPRKNLLWECAIIIKRKRAIPHLEFNYGEAETITAAFWQAIKKLIKNEGISFDLGHSKRQDVVFRLPRSIYTTNEAIEIPPGLILEGR